MKRTWFFLSMLLCVNVYAQTSQWNVQLVVDPYPTSFYSVWQNNSSSLYLTANYTGTIRTDYKVRIVLTNGSNKQLVKLTSPVQSFEAGPGSKTFFAGDFLSWNDAVYDNTTLQQILRTNRFPEGQYEENVFILSADGTILAQTNGSFQIIYPDVASLIDPQNATTEERLSPIFSWTPVNLPPTISAKYNLRIVKRFQGQSIAQAMNVNPVFHEADITTGNLYVYPLSELAPDLVETNFL